MPDNKDHWGHWARFSPYQTRPAIFFHLLLLLLHLCALRLLRSSEFHNDRKNRNAGGAHDDWDHDGRDHPTGTAFSRPVPRPPHSPHREHRLQPRPHRVPVDHCPPSQSLRVLPSRNPPHVHWGQRAAGGLGVEWPLLRWILQVQWHHGPGTPLHWSDGADGGVGSHPCHPGDEEARHEEAVHLLQTTTNPVMRVLKACYALRNMGYAEMECAPYLVLLSGKWHWMHCGDRSFETFWDSCAKYRDYSEACLCLKGDASVLWKMTSLCDKRAIAVRIVFNQTCMFTLLKSL